MASETSGDQNNLPHINTIFELYISYRRGHGTQSRILIADAKDIFGT